MTPATPANPATSSAPVTTVASVVRLFEALASLEHGASFPRSLLPRLAEVIDCDALTYGEVGPAGVVRRLDHVVREPGPGRPATGSR